MDENKGFLAWLTEAQDLKAPLLTWCAVLVSVAVVDFCLLKLGLGDYADIDKTSDFALLYNLVFNSVAVSTNLGGPYTPSGWCLITTAINDPLGLLFYGITISKLVGRNEERLLRDISHKVNLMANEEDWDIMIDSVRERSYQLRNNTHENDQKRLFLLKEMIGYVEKLLQQRPISYKENIINLYECEAILVYTLEGVKACDNLAHKPSAKDALFKLCSALNNYRTGLLSAHYPLVDDPMINTLFEEIEHKCVCTETD